MFKDAGIISTPDMDLQQQIPCMTRCTYCRELVPASDTVQIAGKTICNDCIHDYCIEQYDGLGTDYLLNNEDEYTKSDSLPDSECLFYNWWLSGLEKLDRLRILKDAYNREKVVRGSGYYPTWEKEFCTDADDWQDFVIERRS